MKSLGHGKTNVEIHYNDTKRHAHYRGLMRCDSVWECPVCSSRITSRRAQEIQQAYVKATEFLGCAVVMVTYTMKHNKRQSLSRNLEAMREARRKMRSGDRWQRFKKQWGYKGCISSMEVTYGWESGWHVHVHELMFLKNDTTDNILENETNEWLEKQLHKDLAKWWVESLEKVGRSATQKHGLKVDATDREITWYIAKFGKLPAGRTWDAGLELTKSMSKSNGDGLHPFELLEYSKDLCVPEEERRKLKALWQDYANCFKGRRQTFWTNGLSDYLTILVLADDSEIEEPEGAQAFAIEYKMWKDIVYLDRRAELLNVVCETRFNEKLIKRWLKQTMLDASCRRARFNEHKPQKRIMPNGTIWDYENNKKSIDGEV